MKNTNPSQRIFERLLWGSRLLVIVSVVAGLLLAVGATFLATADVVYFFGLLAEYADPALGSGERDELRVAIVAAITKSLDEYLVSAILIVFSLGLYELFVS